MNAAEHETEHEHEWAWLEQPVFVYTQFGRPFTAYNAACSSCGEQVWAHGTPPNAKPIIVSIPPTTEGS